MSKEILSKFINDFEFNDLERFFRTKTTSFSPSKENLDQYDDENFKGFNKFGEIEFNNQIEKLIIVTSNLQKDLTERSGKKAQYDKAKKILRYLNKYDAGIFIFYDNDKNFRFSLISEQPIGTRRVFSNFKRFTYYVSRELTNKTFLSQIGKDEEKFSSLEKIKEAFSVEKVTKEFFNELSHWYFWAMDKIKLPQDYKYSNDSEKDKEIRNATNLIRLITRIIFIWFLKEKGLIPKILFSRESLQRIVKDFLKNKTESNFYNAILQNLFFATLNQKMNERKFAEESGFPANKKEYGIKNLYRYAGKFLINKEKVGELFEDIPFLNGGLFDCLDPEDEDGKVVYIDGFSRNPKKQAIIPDYLFFQNQEERVDLSQYGLGVNKPVRGLIEILNNYNFTIDENTPIDQEVALDPELLGKVFENLLASYNPETATTARKATGSYYTPREIVDYMAEESLFEYLKCNAGAELAPPLKTDEDKIRILLSYAEDMPEFTKEQKQKIISAIDNIKILDPVGGSGAFPMGILHKLVYVLQKLDRDNKYWYELQYQKALKESEEVFKQNNKYEREERLKEINETFDENINYPDYARKLYLIENCIYGVDIQPIAIQISKLRFFISLVLDQKVDRNKENFGIRALPNLETKFVAANTLIGIEKPQYLFYTDKVRKLEDEIKTLRRRYFQAKTRKEKLEYQRKDRELRKQLADELKSTGFSSESSEKIASFDLFDQNASANWFDPEWMFGITEGFDIVIANPPYVKKENLKKETIKELENVFVEYKDGKQKYWSDDLYVHFIFKGVDLTKIGGVTTYITNDSFIGLASKERARKLLLSYKLLKIIRCPQETFEAMIYTAVFVLKKQQVREFAYETGYFNYPTYDYISLGTVSYRVVDKLPYSRLVFYSPILSIYSKFLSTPHLKKYLSVLDTGIHSGNVRDKVFLKEQVNLKLQRLLQGKQIGRWGIFWNSPMAKYKYCDINYNPEKKKGTGRKGKQSKLDEYWHFCGAIENHHQPERLLMRQSDDDLVVAYQNEKEVGRFYTDNTLFTILPKDKSVNLKYAMALLNSSLLNTFYQFLSQEKGKTLAQVKIGLVDELPFIIDDQTSFIELVNKILAITKDDDYLENSTKQAKVKEYGHQIDQMVYKLYSLTEKEIRIVEEYNE